METVKPQGMTKQEMTEKFPQFDPDLCLAVKVGPYASMRGSFYQLPQQCLSDTDWAILFHEVGHLCEIFGSMDNQPEYYALLDTLTSDETTGSNFQEEFANSVKAYILGRELSQIRIGLLEQWGIVGQYGSAA
jgi:hypothetical protein